jgi:ABC-type bacteriocin/lantibiotic exporter with double-glycine peptidase domain
MTPARLSRALASLQGLATREIGNDGGDDALLQVLRLAARSWGRDATVLDPLPGQTGPGLDPGLDPGRRIENLAPRLGLISRRLVINEGWDKAGTAPLVVFDAGGTPQLLVRSAGLARSRRLLQDPASGARREFDAATAAQLSRVAYQITPALPARRVTTRDLFSLCWPQLRLDLAGYASVSLLAGGLITLLPVAADFLVRKVTPGHESGLLEDIALAMALLVCLNLLSGLAAALATVRIQGKASATLRAAVIDRMIRLVESRRIDATPLLGTQMRAVDGWCRAMIALALGAAGSLVSALPTLLYLLLTAPALTAGLCGLFGFATLAIIGLNRRQDRVLARAIGHLGGWITLGYETLKHIDTVRACGDERRAFTDFAESFGGQQARQLVANRISARAVAVAATTQAAAAALVVALALAVTDPTERGAAIPLLMAALLVAHTGGGLLASLARWPQVKRLHLLIAPLLVEVPPLAALADGDAPLAGAITMDDIVYRPDGATSPTLDGISLSIAAGEHVGIVGPSGAGKSTLIDVLIGLRHPERGTVRYDAVDLSRRDGTALRRQIGIVEQNGALFPGSIASNVTLGEPHAEQEVWSALALAGIDDEVRAMPLGLSTPVGDAVVTLSGGQVQRLLFARAIIGQPRILICDEATSALDGAAQARIIAACRAARMTIITVAHRLDTVMGCDRVHVMDGGRVVEQGTPAALLSAGGLFTRLVEAELAPAA